MTSGQFFAAKSYKLQVLKIEVLITGKYVHTYFYLKASTNNMTFCLKFLELVPKLEVDITCKIGPRGDFRALCSVINRSNKQSYHLTIGLQPELARQNGLRRPLVN